MAAVATWLIPASLALVYLLRGDKSPSGASFLEQDLPVLAALMALAAVISRSGSVRWPLAIKVHVASITTSTLALCLFVLVVGYLGATYLFGGYSFSLDEFMADFDARIFASGNLIAPIPGEWRHFAPALNPRYVAYDAGRTHWISGYLPVNALARAAARNFGLQYLVNPALSAISVIAVFAVARRLWPSRPSMALGAAALLASSSQLLVTAMTAYAMPAYLALNLTWLYLFLRGGRVGHASTLAVGFVACGIHQIIFHPLFVAPFIASLWRRDRKPLALFYIAVYILICIFWSFYWSILFGSVGAKPAGVAAAGGFFRTAAALLTHVSAASIGPMAEGLTRFVTWQNPLMPPLMMLGIGASMAERGPLRSLAAGVVFTLATMFLLVPNQGNGWGYRYLHGLLGSGCLLAIWYWTKFTDQLPERAQRGARAVFVIGCAVSVLVLLPLRAWQAWAFVRPYAAAEKLIRQAPSQVVLVDSSGLWFDDGAIARNDPFLMQNPKVIFLGSLSERGLQDLCSKYSVLLFDGRTASRLGIYTTPVARSARVSRLEEIGSKLGCMNPI